ncbi:hypothetical protein BJY04DRAFT_203834 [Aspergillus karnatakaensis]|uniref:Zn(II)2Cys6 transcription factor domain-containing protein n=1 Tax=Aspergillus karnatakaensis TaxID=1810916 RepID=UPI003CCC9327
MVGVPRSTGCQTCVKRRVKCDEARPQCLRCTKFGVQCLGYDRPLQFRNSGPDEAQQRQRARAIRLQRSSSQHQQSQPVLPLSSSPSIDETVAPNLIYEALTSQTKEVFYDWLIYHFPRVHSSFVFRVDLGWMNFVRHLTPSQCPPALLWAIRTLITFQMGTLQRNKEAINCARYMYGRGIYYLRKLLQSPAALSDESLAACILLGGYEVLDGNNSKSWIVHTSGIRQLMCARGAQSHKSGIGRTLMISFRPFFIAEAFVFREPCFLADPEWTSLTDDIFDDRLQRGQGELTALAMDYIFDETAKCPGYYARTEAILASDSEPAPFELESLSSEIARSIAHLLEVQDKLNLAATDPLCCPAIPSTHMDSMTQLTLKGLHSALGLLSNMSAVLRMDKQQQFLWRQTGHDLGVQDVLQLHAMDGPAPAVSSDPAATFSTPESTNEPIGDWLDRFSSVMGATTATTGPGSPSKQLLESGSLDIIGER